MGCRPLFALVVVALATAQQRSYCGLSAATAPATTCNVAGTPATACATCFPSGAGAGCTMAIDPVTAVVTLTTTQPQTYGAGNFSYPWGVRLVFNAGVTFAGAGTNVSFCVPNTQSYALTLMQVQPNAAVSMSAGAMVTLIVGPTVPTAASVLLLNVSTPAQWTGILGATPAQFYADAGVQCTVLQALPSYGTGTVSVALSETASNAPACQALLHPGGAGGLSGGQIAGIFLGAFFGAAALIVVAVFVFRRIDFDSKRQLFSRTKIHAAESSVPM